MTESLPKAMTRDYVAFMSEPDALFEVHDLDVALNHYNEKNPGFAEYRLPHEFQCKTDLV